MGSMLADDHLREREVFLPMDDEAGEFIVPATPFRFDGEVTPKAHTRVPALGADTDDILASLRRT
jgi:crotonobetainyl-CoA:carnitine CoA-transferase CaiB-like acyl-CoA transferase